MADNNLQDLDPATRRAGENAEVNFSGEPMNPAGVWRHMETGQEIIALSTPKFGTPQADAYKRIGFEWQRYVEPGELVHRSAAAQLPVVERTEDESVESLKARLAVAQSERDAAIAAAKVQAEAQAELDAAADADRKRQAGANEAVAAAGFAKATLDEQAGANTPVADTVGTSDTAEASQTDMTPSVVDDHATAPIDTETDTDTREDSSAENSNSKDEGSEN